MEGTLYYCLATSILLRKSKNYSHYTATEFQEEVGKNFDLSLFQLTVETSDMVLFQLKPQLLQEHLPDFYDEISASMGINLVDVWCDHLDQIKEEVKYLFQEEKEKTYEKKKQEFQAEIIESLKNHTFKLPPPSPSTFFQSDKYSFCDYLFQEKDSKKGAFEYEIQGLTFFQQTDMFMECDIYTFMRYVRNLFLASSQNPLAQAFFLDMKRT